MHVPLAELCIDVGKPMVTASYVSDAMQALDAGPFLNDWPPLVASHAVPATWLPVCDCLPQLAAQAAGPLAPLVAGLIAGARAMDWRQTYGVADFGADFLQGYGWTELIGPPERMTSRAARS